MRRFLSIALVCSLASAALSLIPAGGPSPPGAEAWAGPAATLMDFMLVSHGQKGLWGQMNEAASGGALDEKGWKTMQARANVLVYLGESILAKSTPEKGDKASWKTKTGEYLGLTRALAKAAGGKDAAGVKAELARISKGCDSCHKLHR